MTQWFLCLVWKDMAVITRWSYKRGCRKAGFYCTVERPQTATWFKPVNRFSCEDKGENRAEGAQLSLSPFLQLFLLDFLALPRPEGLFTGYWSLSPSTMATYLSSLCSCRSEILLWFGLARSRFPVLGKWFMHLPLIWFIGLFVLILIGRSKCFSVGFITHYFV